MSKAKQKTRKKLTIPITFLVIICLLSISYFTFFYSEQTKEEIVEEEEYELDDRISPLENQGLILEINRIRHRGLVDKIMKIGPSWRNKPSFYFISNMDGLEYVSKDIEAAGGAASETLFNTWDTIFQENKVVKDAEEEQEKSEVSLTIVERVKKGILGRRSDDFERETIQVTYDYRTGRWTGDDYLQDDDGYGHYVGEYFEVWFNIYQMDYDGDKIPYWTEVNVLHTDPYFDDSELDPDEDGIPTFWEWRWGYDPKVWDDHMRLDPDIDGIENIEEYQMAKWFADPFSQDIYIEADGMKKGGLFDWEHVLYEESKQILIERFSQHGINMYIDDGWPGGPVNGGGELLPHYETISQDSGMMLQFYKNHFSDERKGIFRYLVIGHNAGFCHPSELNRYDTMAVGTSPKKMFINRKAFTPRAHRLVLASAVMHETGHSLGISFWTIEGCDNLTYVNGRTAKKQFLDTWANYKSCMNYYYIFDKNVVDYSDGNNDALYDQNDWLYLYLPHFQNDDSVIEESFFEHSDDKIIDEEFEVTLDGWTYDEDITQKYVEAISGWSPVDPIECEWRVYVKTDDANSPSDRNLRAYARPILSYSEWILIEEGNLVS